VQAIENGIQFHNAMFKLDKTAMKLKWDQDQEWARGNGLLWLPLATRLS
jgi:hypothetical protein